MKWGVWLIAAAMPGDDHHQVIQDALLQARAAEELGYDEAWVLEHHFTGYGTCGSPLTMASFVLGQTRTLRVGTGVSVIPLEHPLRLAEEVALLDNMSGGRFLFGVGRGLFVKDFKVFGVDMEYNREIMEEWVEVMQRAWREPSCAHAGRYVSFEEVEVFPRVLTQPHPPMYVAAHSPSTIEFAAKRGLPMMLTFILDDAAKLAQLELYAAVASDQGFDPATIDHAISCIAGVGAPGFDIVAASRARLTWWQEEFVRASMIFTPDHMNMRGYEWQRRQWEQLAISGKFPIAERVESNFRINPIGSVQECVDKLNRTVEATGVGHYILGFESAGASSTLVLDSMQRFKEEVIPRVAAAAPSPALAEPSLQRVSP